MPNHVQNIVRLRGDEKRVQETLEAVKSDQYGLGSVDFEKIIPMPPSLHIECGSKTDRGLNAYRDFLKSEAESEKEYLDQKPTITPEEWELGKQAYENLREYGAPTWYEWSVAHWGTKWNAYGMDENAGERQSNELRFQTAWSAPRPILEKLARMYPRITFEHEWADEDIGVNCGRHIYQGGERVEEYYPEGDVQSTEFALSVWDYDASDLSLTLNAAGTKYINMEMEEYELIELFGKPALFSKGRMTAEDIPEGLFSYYLRRADDGDGFAAIESCGSANCGGSVITDTPIDFGEKGSIAFTEETAPNFLGQTITFGEYTRGEFDPEEQNNEMGDLRL